MGTEGRAGNLRGAAPPREPFPLRSLRLCAKLQALVRVALGSGSSPEHRLGADQTSRNRPISSTKLQGLNRLSSW